MNVNKRTRLINWINGFLHRTAEDHVMAYAAGAAYFTIMAAVPFILFLTTLVRFTPVSYNAMRKLIVTVMPMNVQEFILSIVADVYRRSAAIVPFTLVLALWSAGKGVHAITNGLNIVYHVKETRNWLMNRLYSSAYTFLFIVAIIVSLLVMVLGEQLYRLVLKHNQLWGRILEKLILGRTLLVGMILLLVFLILFRYLPNRQSTFRKELPGALFTTVAWIVTSWVFSLYFDLSQGFTNMYGNVAAAVILMLWLYWLMILMLYGAELNTYFRDDIKKLYDSFKHRLKRFIKGTKNEGEH